MTINKALIITDIWLKAYNTYSQLYMWYTLPGHVLPGHAIDNYPLCIIYDVTSLGTLVTASI